MKTGYLAERSKQLHLAALSLAQGLQLGAFRSHFRGRGIEFDSLREYELGDDIRSIDWNLMARSGKTFVKCYREERDLRLFLIADLSLSMKAGCTFSAPQEKLLEAVALIIFAAEHLHSSIGLLIFDGAIAQLFPLQRGHGACLYMLNKLEKYAVSPHKIKGTALASALEQSAKLLKQRTLVIILSDFKVENFEKELKLLARQHDTAAIRIMAPFDDSLPAAGVICFADPETGYERLIPTNARQFRQDRIQCLAEDIQQWKDSCIRCGAYPLVIPHDGNTIKLLNQFFSADKYHASYRSRFQLSADTML